MYDVVLCLNKYIISDITIYNPRNHVYLTCYSEFVKIGVSIINVCVLESLLPHSGYITDFSTK